MEEFNWDGSKYSTTNGLQADIGHLLLESACIGQDEIILDLGCGVGNLTFALAKKVPGGHVLGIDASTSMIEQCLAAKAELKADNVSFEVKSALDITDKNVYSLIFSNSVLHWIKEADMLLQALYIALKNQGKLLLQFPLLHSSHPLVRISNEVIRQYGLSSFYENWDFPWYVPQPEEYAELLTQTGFSDIQIHPLCTGFHYNNAQEVYNFLDAVGLKLYSEPLPSGIRDLFLKGVREELSRMEGEYGIQLTFDRILISASKIVNSEYE